MDLVALADFNLVARHAGFGRAARATGRPKATLSRRVAELEAALALRLFERGGRGLKLTEEGRALYERTSALLSELDDTAAAIAVRDAVRAGVGVAQLPVSLVSHDLAAGRLVYWGDIDAPGITLWALYPSRRLLSARVSGFVEYLKEVFPLGIPEELAAFLGV